MLVPFNAFFNRHLPCFISSQELKELGAPLICIEGSQPVDSQGLLSKGTTAGTFRVRWWPGGREGNRQNSQTNQPNYKLARGHSLLSSKSENGFSTAITAAHHKFVCISTRRKQWGIVCLALRDALGYSLSPRTYIDSLIIRCFGGGYCICLMSEITP